VTSTTNLALNYRSIGMHYLQGCLEMMVKLKSFVSFVGVIVCTCSN